MTAVSVATAADAPLVGEILARGFHDDPMMRWMFEGDDATRAAKLDAFFGFLAVEAHVPLGASFVADGACACWCPPPGIDHWPDDRSARFGELLGTVCSAQDLTRLGIVGDTFDPAHPTEPHWYLGTIAVVPEHQHTGRGSALLEHCLALVDATGMPAYLESSNPENVAFYTRFGFEVVAELPLGADGPVVPAMWPPALPP